MAPDSGQPALVPTHPRPRPRSARRTGNRAASSWRRLPCSGIACEGAEPGSQAAPQGVNDWTGPIRGRGRGRRRGRVRGSAASRSHARGLAPVFAHEPGTAHLPRAARERAGGREPFVPQARAPSAASAPTPFEAATLGDSAPAIQHPASSRQPPIGIRPFHTPHSGFPLFAFLRVFRGRTPPPDPPCQDSSRSTSVSHLLLVPRPSGRSARETRERPSRRRPRECEGKTTRDRRQTQEAW